MRTALPLAAPGFALLAVLWLGGCNQDDIKSYEAPKDSAPAASAPMGGGMMTGNATPPSLPHWTAPSGWEELPGSGMRYATFLPEPPDTSLAVRVTPLGMMANDPLSNANRWAGQIGLPPMDEAGLAKVSHKIPVGDSEGLIIDLLGNAEEGQVADRILAAIVEGGDRVWFLMLPGPKDRVQKHAKGFEDLVKSIRFHGATGMPMGHPDISGVGDGMGAPADGGMGSMGGGMAGSAGGAGEHFTYTAPAGWKEVPSDVQFRDLTLQAGSAEVTVTKFPGSVGGLLMNVNRWRGQVGLSPVQDLSQQPLTDRKVAGGAAQRLDLVGSDGKAMAVVIVPRGALTWFLKISGSAEELKAQGESFDRFVDSAGFTE
ncbi:MAG: hypothetical protein R3B81_03945 [bacterium]|nr:hypothetical protein [Gemmatimonadota bacterium]